eukprot:7384137-Pyramimonas_sp.AAC.1
MEEPRRVVSRAPVALPNDSGEVFQRFSGTPDDCDFRRRWHIADRLPIDCRYRDCRCRLPIPTTDKPTADGDCELPSRILDPAGAGHRLSGATQHFTGAAFR